MNVDIFARCVGTVCHHNSDHVYGQIIMWILGFQDCRGAIVFAFFLISVGVVAVDADFLRYV